MRDPTKEELAQALREYPTWAHAYVAMKDHVQDQTALLADVREALELAIREPGCVAHLGPLRARLNGMTGYQQAAKNDGEDAQATRGTVV